MKDWKKTADKNIVEEVIGKLKERNINALFVKTGEDAKNKVLELIPPGSRVLASSSITLESTGLADEIDKSGKFISVRKEYMAFDHEKEADKIRISRSAPEFIVGSVHAVTRQGEVVIASNTGSQLAGYVYGAGKVIWVVGTQKIVENLDEAMERIYNYVLNLESERLNKAYGAKSNVSKLLIVDKEVAKDRMILIFVNEVLGF